MAELSSSDCQPRLSRTSCSGVRTSSGRANVRRLLTLALAFLLAAPFVAEGQVGRVMPRDAAAEREHAAECRSAARVINSGTPEPELRSAWDAILDCGHEAPAALAAATRRLRVSHDTIELNAIIRAASFFSDAEFFDAALEVAADPAATPQARVAGFLISAMELTDRTSFDFQYLLDDPKVLICPLSVADHSLRIHGGAPLPVDARARVLAAAGAVTRSEPNAVHVAASCATIVVRTLTDLGG